MTYKCSRCSSASTCEVWGYRLCSACDRAWLKEAPEVGSDFDDQIKEYQAFTRRFVEKAKA